MSDTTMNSTVSPTDAVSHVSIKLQQYFLHRDVLNPYSYYPGTERTQYDFASERMNKHTTGIVRSIVHLTMSCLGAGVLVIHVGYMLGGLWTSLVATAVLAPIVSHCMLMQVRSAQKMYVRLRVPRLSYSALAEAAAARGPCTVFRKYAKPFRYTVDTSLFIGKCGVLCIYEIMIAITIKEAIESVSSSARTTDLSIRWYLLIVTVPLLIICVIRSLRAIAITAIFASFFIALCVVVTICYTLWAVGSQSGAVPWRGVQGLCGFLGVCLFSISGVDVVLSAENHMTRPRYIAAVLHCSMSIVITCVTAVGFIGYLNWGQHCKGPFTIHLQVNTVTVVIQFIISAMLCITYSAQFWAPFRIAWHYIGKKHKRKRVWWDSLYRSLLVILITIICIAIPDMSKITMFVGNFFAAHVAFIFPSIIESLVTWQDHNKGIRWMTLKHCFLIALGILFNMAAFYAVLI